MSKFDLRFIQTNKQLSSNSNKAVYPYEESNDECEWIIQHLSVNDFENFNNIIQAITLNSDPHCPALAPIEAYYIQKNDSNKWDIYVKMPRMRQTLREKIDKNRKNQKYPSEMELIYCLYSLTKCLEYLEQKSIMHNNIKPTNILFDGNDCVYLSDGKMLKIQDEECSNGFIKKDNPLFYMEPLILANQNENGMAKKDVWSLGIVMLEFSLCDINIKSAYTSMEEKRNMVHWHIDKLKDRYSKDFIDIVAGLLDVDLNQRKTFQQTRILIEQRFQYIKEDYNRRREIQAANSLRTAATGESRRIRSKESFFSLGFIKLMGLMGIIAALSLYYIIKIYDIELTIPNSIHTNLELKNRNSKLEHDETLVIPVYETRFPFKHPNDIPNENAEQYLIDTDYSNDYTEDGDSKESVSVDNQFESERSLALNSEETGPNNLQPANLELSFVQNLEENEIQWKDYFQLTREANNLEITASRVLEIDDPVLNSLVSGLKQILQTSEFNDLKSFTLFLWRCEKITDLGIKLLRNVFAQNGFSLKSLTLGFNSLKLITDEGIKNVALHVLKYQTCLESLALDFFNCPEITDQWLLRLSSSISKYQNGLKRLSLIFSRCNQITDKGLGYSTLQALISLKDLQFLSISFGRTSISDRGLIQLGLDLAKYGQALTKLEIKIYGCDRISDKGFQSLASDIAQNLKQLTHLQFSIWETAISFKAQQSAKKKLEFISDLDISN